MKLSSLACFKLVCGLRVSVGLQVSLTSEDRVINVSRCQVKFA